MSEHPVPLRRASADASADRPAGTLRVDRLTSELLAFDLDHVNRLLEPAGGRGRPFFASLEELEECRRTFARDDGVDSAGTGHSGLLRDRQWGDFQTPPDLARDACRLLESLGVCPDVVIDPTCGEGIMLGVARQHFGATVQRLYGVEIQTSHYWQARARLSTSADDALRVDLRRDDIFTHTFDPDLLQARELLILGNPPWVTNAELGSRSATNMPSKQAPAGMRGYDALTGRSNFDLAEVIIAMMLDGFSGRRGTLAMLCKQSVARRIVMRRHRERWECPDVRLYTIDAQRHFAANVGACLMVARFGSGERRSTVPVASLALPQQIVHSFGWVNDRFVADVDQYNAVSDLDGTMPFEWRQGIKHDCTAVMEVVERAGDRFNVAGERVDVEAEWLYPLAKSRDLTDFVSTPSSRRVIVTQHAIGAPTSGLEHDAPGLWRYLTAHATALARRRSSIYRGAPPFAIFGIGPYSFKPFKVALCGLHKEALFVMLPPVDGRPVMLDDTCYFLGFDSVLDALFTATLLRHHRTQAFLRTMAFTDAKRPFTKSLLMRVDLSSIAHTIDWNAVVETWDRCGYDRSLVPAGRADYEAYCEMLGSMRDVRAR